MKPTVAREGNIRLPDYAEPILQTLFAQQSRVIIKREFGNTRSGSRVYLVQPIGTRGSELPLVVKLASTSLIEREWRAYQRTRGMLYGLIEVQDIVLPDGEPQGALCYPLRGGNLFKAVTLQDSYASQGRTDVLAMVGRLFKALQSIHNQSTFTPDFLWRASYDHLLPPNLLIDVIPVPDNVSVCTVTPETVGHPCPQREDWVSVEGFAVTKVDLVKQTVTFNLPALQQNKRTDSFVIRAKWTQDIPAFREGEIVPVFTGAVRTTRETELEAQVNKALGARGSARDSTFVLADGTTSLPNPLAGLPSILNHYDNVRISLIHGDLNLDNVLVDVETGHVSLIDVTEAREDHILHDFLRLEAEVMTKLVSDEIRSNGIAPDLAVFELYRQLHCSVFEPDAIPGWISPRPEFEKPYQVLRAIRRAAQRYFYTDSPAEYYQGLLIYLLGALKFSDLDDLPSAPLPKQVALWGAATVFSLLTSPVACQDITNRPIDLPRKPHALIIDCEPDVKLQRSGSNRLDDATYGTRLYRGDTVHTYTDAYALIHCYKGPSFSVPQERTKVVDCDQVSNKEALLWPDPYHQDPVSYLAEGLISSPIDAAPAVPPILLSPRNTSVATRRPAFNWRPVPGANSYRLEIRMPGGATWSHETTAARLPYPDNAPPLLPGSNNTVVLTAIGTEHTPDITQLRCLETRHVANLEESEAEIQRLVLSDSARAYLLSRLYQHWQIWDRAAEMLEHFAETAGTISPDLWTEMAGLYMRMALYGEAQKRYEQALAAAPTDGTSYGEACLGLACLHMLQRSTAEAIAHLRRAARTEYADLAQHLIQHLEPQIHLDPTHPVPVSLADYVQFLAEQIAPTLKGEIQKIAAPFLARLQRMSHFELRPAGTWSLAQLGSNDFGAMGILAATYITTATLISELHETGATSTTRPEHLTDIALEQARQTFRDILGATSENVDTLVDRYAALADANPDVLRHLSGQEGT